MQAAELGQRSELTCEIKGNITDGIVWTRPNGGLPQKVIGCNQANTACGPYGGMSGYSVSIDSPTRLILTIYSFSFETDAGRWKCSDGDGDSSSCEKTVVCKLPLMIFTLVCEV